MLYVHTLIDKYKNFIMTITETINALLVKYDIKLSAEPIVEVKLASLELEDGTMIHSEDEEIIEGSIVTVENADKEFVALPSGDYTDKDLRVLTVEDGVVISIAEAVAPVEEEIPVVEVEQADMDLPKAVTDVLERTVKALKAEFAEQLKVKDTEIAELKVSFEEQGLPRARTAGDVIPKQKITQKDIVAMTPKERVNYFYTLNTKTTK